MRWTELTETPTAAAMAPAVQCVASCGGAVLVKATTRSRTACSSGRMRGGRVLSRTRPSHEPLLPAPDAGLGLAGLAHHGIGSETGGGEKHNPRTPDVLLRAVPITDDRIQSLTVRSG